MSQITVTNIQGQTSGGNANKVIITSGHTLEVTSNSTVGGSLTAPDIRATAIKSPTGTASTTIANDGKVTFNSSVEQSGSTLPQLGMFKILDATISSPVSYYDIDSTYINSTYDSYEIEYILRSSSDNDHLRNRVFVGGTVQTGSIYSWVTGSQGNSDVGASTQDGFRLNRFSVGNETGAFIGGRMRLQNVNSTSFSYMQTGQSISFKYSDGSFSATDYSGALILANRADVVNGIRFYYAANIESGTIKVYGIK